MVDVEREWGVNYTMDLKGCNPVTMRSKQSIQEYVIALCKEIDIERLGDCQIVALEDGSLVLSQVLDGGFISGRFLATQNYLHLNMFCDFAIDLITTANMSLEFFGATEISTHYSVKY